MMWRFMRQLRNPSPSAFRQKFSGLKRPRLGRSSIHFLRRLTTVVPSNHFRYVPTRLLPLNTSYLVPHANMQGWAYTIPTHSLAAFARLFCGIFMQKGNLRFIHALLPSLCHNLSMDQAQTLHKITPMLSLFDGVINKAQAFTDAKPALLVRSRISRPRRPRRPPRPAPRVLKFVPPRNYKQPQLPKQPKSRRQRIRELVETRLRISRRAKRRLLVRAWSKLKSRALTKRSPIKTWSQHYSQYLTARRQLRYNFTPKSVTPNVKNISFKTRVLQQSYTRKRSRQHFFSLKRLPLVSQVLNRPLFQHTNLPYRPFLQSQLELKKAKRPKPKIRPLSRRSLVAPLQTATVLPQHAFILLLNLLVDQPVLNYSLKYCRLSRRVRKILKNKYRFSKYFFAIAPHKRQLYTIHLWKYVLKFQDEPTFSLRVRCLLQNFFEPHSDSLLWSLFYIQQRLALKRLLGR